MKKITTFFQIMFLISNCLAQPAKELQFRQAVARVIKAFSEQDSAAITKLTNPKIGVYHLWHGNTFLNFLHLDTVKFSPPGRFIHQLTDCKGIEVLPLQYGRLPEIACDSERWNKVGAYVDTAVIDHMVSEGLTYRNKYEPHSYPDTLVHFFRNLELESRRVIVQDAKQHELVFYLSFINGRWYLTIIDKASSDCSA